MTDKNEKAFARPDQSGEVTSDLRGDHRGNPTPGPWEVRVDRIADIAVCAVTHPKPTICLVTGGLDDRFEDGMYGPTSHANAHLIAAAPELLEALKAILAQFDAGYFVRNTQGDDSPDWVIKAARSVRTLAAGVQAIAKATGQ